MSDADSFDQILDDLTAEPTAIHLKRLVGYLVEHEPDPGQTLRVHQFLLSSEGRKLRRSESRLFGLLDNAVPPLPSAKDPETVERGHDSALRGRELERKVAQLFELQGYDVKVNVEIDGHEFDVLAEKIDGLMTFHVIVECKDLKKGAGKPELREFDAKLNYLRRHQSQSFEAMLVSVRGFKTQAYEQAKTYGIRLATYDELMRSLVDFKANLNAAIRSFEGTDLEKHYVEQEVVYQSDIQPEQEVTAKSLTESVKAWISGGNGTFLTLLGDFGSGKTSFCQRLACELAKHARDEPEGNRIPILIDLREGRSTTVTLDNLLTHHFQQLAPNKPLSTQALLQLNREGYLVIFFDGFDEIVGYTEPGRYVEVLRQVLAAAAGRAKVIMTCRTHYFRDRPDEVKSLGTPSGMLSDEGATQLYEELRGRAGVEIGYLREFSQAQIEEYLRKAVQAGDWRAFRDEIRRTYNLQDLAERPFLLEMIVKTLPKLSEKGGEVTLAGLYEVYCESWFAHTDLRLALTREHRVAIVEFLAVLLWNRTDQKIHHSQLFTRLTASLPELFGGRELTPHDERQIDYEVRTALFLRRDEEGHYRFIHRSFLEFFVARTLRRGLEDQEITCLDLRPLTREVVFFLEFWEESEAIPRLAATVLEQPYRPQISENALRLLYLHARSRLGPLVGPGAGEREEIDLDSLAASCREFSLDRFELAGANLAGADLRGIDLRGARLVAANLRRADLRGATLDDADLTDADLTLANLRNASFVGSKLRGAKLSNVDARGADFRRADVRKTDLAFGSFVRANFIDARLAGAETQGAGFFGTVGVSISLVEPAGAPAREPGEVRELVPLPQVGHANQVWACAWSPDGRRLASGSSDKTIRIWDAQGRRLLRILRGHTLRVLSVAWDPSGSRLASGSDDHTVRIWDASSGCEQVTLEGHTLRVWSVAWAPCGGRLASGSSDQTVKIWDASSGHEQSTLEGHTLRVWSVAWAPGGNRLASGSSDHTVRIWDASSGREQSTLEGHWLRVLSVAWAPDGSRLASGSSDHTVRIWDTSSGREQATLRGHTESVESVVWAPNGTRLASGSDDHTVRIWDASSGREQTKLEDHTQSVGSVVWAPGGGRLASGSDDHTVKIWDALSSREQATLEGHAFRVLSVVWAPDGSRLASGSSDHTVRIWDASSGREQSTLEGHTLRVLSVAWAPGGNRLASGSSDQTVKIWGASSSREQTKLEGHTQSVRSVVWAPDGSRLASGSSDHTVRIWDASSGREQSTLEGHTQSVGSVAWAPGGSLLASGSSDQTVKIWDVSNGHELSTLKGHTSVVWSVAWDSSGSLLASGSDDQTVKIWDVASGCELTTLEGHTQSVGSVVWAPDGSRLASGSSDQTVKIWDTASGCLQHTLTGLESYVRQVAWHPNGRYLAVGTGAGIIYLWGLSSAEPLCLARLYEASPVTGLVVTHDGYVDGPQKALDNVRFADGWALYDLDDFPERNSPERVREVLAFAAEKT